MQALTGGREGWQPCWRITLDVDSTCEDCSWCAEPKTGRSRGGFLDTRLEWTFSVDGRMVGYGHELAEVARP